MTGVASGITNKQTEWPCGSTRDVLSDRQGKPVWISFDELKEHARVTDYPEVPSPFRTKAKIILGIRIDTEGTVSCIKLEGEGHPALVAAAVRSIKKWKFSPFSAGGHPVSVFGRVEFQFGNESEGSHQ
jgi:outer membrane biosynthesis protein TonB